jgi:formate hydrogenlyase subunit 3/multisubunit Na+/H+ antiporter MnhD subunit
MVFISVATLVFAMLASKMVIFCNSKITLNLGYIYGAIGYTFATTRYGVVFFSLITLLYPIALLYTLSYIKSQKLENEKQFLFFLNLAIFAGLGVSISADLFTMVTFYELITLSTYPLLLSNTTDRNRSSTRYYLSYLLPSSVVFLVPLMIYIYNIAGTVTFNNSGILEDIYVSQTAINLMLIFSIIGFAKVCIVPMHTWLVKAMVAPAPVSAILHAVIVVKSGLFGIIMFATRIIGLSVLRENIWKIGHFNILAMIASLSIVYASIMAIRQDDLKERLAYSTITQIAMSLLALSTLSNYGSFVSMVQFFAHGVAKIALFFGAGAVYIMNGSYSLAKTPGLWRKSPVVCITMLMGALSIVGLPPTVGFYAKYTIISAALASQDYIAVAVCMLSAALSAMYIFGILYYIFFVPMDSVYKSKERHLPIGISVSLWLLCGLLIVSATFINKLFLDLLRY